MAKNEAKIRFSAETGEFNNQIKQSNAEMSKLRAEMKLNDEQMKTAGKSVEGLEQKQKLLEAQMTASRQKTEALSQKVQAAVEIYGENSEEVKKLQMQLITAQTAEERLQRQISACNDELESQRAAANRVATETEKLNDTIENQQSELNKLKDEYKEAVLKYGAASDEAKELAGQIDTLSGELKENKRVMSDASQAADELDKSLDDASDNDGGGFTVFKGALADLISNGIQFAIGKVNELVDYMWGLPEATREIRQDFATLTTAFDNMGYSTETATETWKGLYGVFGEDDRAVETANNIAKIAQNEEDLNNWVTITTGVWGTYQDSLPVEGLAEAANETAKVGTVTGGLADALNWSSEAAVMFADYMGGDVVTAEDAFNAALAECNTEQERQRLITDTLTKLYGGAAETYRETSGAMLEAKEATAENILAENNLATALEPVTTKWQELTNEFKTNLQPAAEKVSEWAIGAMEWMQEHPTLVSAIAAAVGVLAIGITGLATAWGVYTIAQWAANSALLASPITWIVLAIVAAIAALVAIIVVVIQKWDEIKAAVLTAVDAIWNAIQTAWNWIVELFSSIGTWIYDNVIAPVLNFFIGLWEGIVSAFHTVIDPWIEIIKRAIPIIYEKVIQPVAQFFVDLWNGIVDGLKVAWEFISGIFSPISAWINEKVIQPVTNFFSNMWSKFKDGASNAWNGIKSIFSKVADFFGDIFGKAWQKVKNVFSVGGKIFDGIKDGIVNAFKSVVNVIIGGINKVVSVPFNGLNNILNRLQGIEILKVRPFSWLTWRAPIPQIPLLAEGGILTRPTLNIAGEAGPEAVIPIDKLQSYISGSVERAMQVVNMQALVYAIEDLANRAIELNINGRKFATATAGDADIVNGDRMQLTKRGLAL